MFLQRALVTLILGPLALYLVYQGGLFYFIPVAIVLALATVEYINIMQAMGRTLSVWILLPAVGLIWVVGQWPGLQNHIPALGLGLLISMAYSLWLYENQAHETAVFDWMAMMGGVLILGWIGSHFFRIRLLEQLAWQWTMLALLGTWVADSAAYLVGRFLAGQIILGRHPLSPRLSPNKTIEGYVGGIVIATIVVAVVASFIAIPLISALILAVLVSAISPLGDLGISLLKREAGVKDSGNLLPGHGGALDRIDSLIWSVMMVYYLALFLS